MRSLTASDLLQTAEVLQEQRPLEQALTILHVAFPESDREALADLTVSERDTRLLELRERTLGVKLEGRADCERCGTNLEFAICTTDFERADVASVGLDDFEKDDLHLKLRMPTSRDLFAVMDLSSEEGRRVLAQRCIVNIKRNGQSANSEALPDGLIASVAQQLSECEPTAEWLVNVACPACGHQWQVLLDIGSFFSKEIETLARRLLLEVHLLATAYGWTEREILSLSARRRHAYLELVGYA